MKIKVIDLYYKTIKNEEVPKVIKYDNTIWEYDKDNNDYYSDEWLFSVKMVSIGTKTDKIKNSKEWRSFGHDGSIFADEYEKRSDGSRGWPAIWKVSEAFEKEGYGYGCGNSGQHQFDCAKFVEGVYEFKEGKWYLIEEKEK
jgi:hypothetical protein